jgi:hypothetical protein
MLQATRQIISVNVNVKTRKVAAAARVAIAPGSRHRQAALSIQTVPISGTGQAALREAAQVIAPILEVEVTGIHRQVQALRKNQQKKIYKTRSKQRLHV